MKTKLSLTIACLISIGAFSTPSFADGDVTKGEKTFKKKCKSCHTLKAGKKSSTGPNLAGFLSRPAGKLEGFKYSKNMKAADFTWDEETLDKWLKNPKKMIKGSRMSMKLGKEKDRKNVIAYLLTVAQ